MNKHFLISFLLFIIAGTAMSQAENKKFEVAIYPLTENMVELVNFKDSTALEYIKTFRERAGTYFDNDDTKRDMLILLTFHTESNPTIITNSSPRMEKPEREKYENMLRNIPPVRSLLVDHSFFFHVKINGGTGLRKEDMGMMMQFPYETEMTRFKTADIQGKYIALKKWAAMEVLPVLGAFEFSTDSQFAGVKRMGEMVNDLHFTLHQDVEKLTDRNPMYWRAVMEMQKGNQIITVTKVFMHVANGEFDYAGLYLGFLSYFSNDNTLADSYMKELSKRLKLFNDAFNVEIKKGIALHDAGQYTEAVGFYERLRSAYPYSAWANYEWYYSKNALELKNGNRTIDNHSDWDEAKLLVYGADPMYPVCPRASNGREGYRLFRRQEISAINKENNYMTWQDDLVKYADIALDLEAYGVAAHLYWFIFTYVPEEEYQPREMQWYFLYCLDKLGDTETRKFFKGNFEKEFKKIADEREKLMITSPVYKSFANK